MTSINIVKKNTFPHCTGSNYCSFVKYDVECRCLQENFDC